MLSLESLGDDQTNTEYIFFDARADDTTDKKGRNEPERSDRYKRGETPLLQVFGKDMVKGRMLSGDGSNFNKLVRLLKHLDSCVSRIGRCNFKPLTA